MRARRHPPRHRLAGTGLLRADRAARAAHPGPREDCKRYRPSGARVILQAASRGGRRLRLRYLGAVKDNAWLKHRADAVAVWYAVGRIAHDQACRARTRRIRRVFA